jgi:hypothetical protein
MQITIGRRTLLSALKTAAPAVAGKSTLPVLINYDIKADARLRSYEHYQLLETENPFEGEHNA